MAREWDPDDIFDVLADKRVRSILIASNGEKRSVKDLDRVLDASLSSIYRRVDVMADFGLLQEQTKMDADGHHYSVYEPSFSSIEIQILASKLQAVVHDGDAMLTKYEVPDE